MSELADIREAIARLLDPIPELKLVQRYERADVGSNQLPAASLFLAAISPPDHESGEVPRFGSGDFKAEWRINVRLSTAQGPAPEVVAQQLFETLHARIRGVLAASGTLTGDDTNNTWISVITSGGFRVPQAAGDPFIALYTLTTLTLT